MRHLLCTGTDKNKTSNINTMLACSKCCREKSKQAREMGWNFKKNGLGRPH